MNLRWKTVAIGTLVLAAIFVPFLQMLLPAYPRYGKGGVGLVSESVYVHTTSKKNEVFEFSTHRPLFTGESNSFQLKVVGTQGKIGPVLLLFTQSAIYFYDFSRFSGGNYLRSEDA